MKGGAPRAQAGALARPSCTRCTPGRGEAARRAPRRACTSVRRPMTLLRMTDPDLMTQPSPMMASWIWVGGWG
jgi:hypothetical protein